MGTDLIKLFLASDLLTDGVQTLVLQAEDLLGQIKLEMSLLALQTDHQNSKIRRVRHQ